MKEKIHIVYLCIHQRLISNCSINNEMKVRDLFSILGRIYHIPKKFFYPIMKELINLNLIERPNRKFIKILDSQLDLDDTSHIYQSVGMF